MSHPGTAFADYGREQKTNDVVCWFAISKSGHGLETVVVEK